MGTPDLSIELSIEGIVAGIDEAGRGPWAGPVVAAAVILERTAIPDGINDSKQLSRTQRETVCTHIQTSARWGVGLASAQEIDTLNILQASLLAMQRAYEALGAPADCALVDGNRAPLLPCRTMPVVKGDGKSLSIAAASIVAKVTRDRLMCELAERYPGYGFEKNAGYGTRAHQQGLAKLGVCPEHRTSYAPIRALLAESAA